MRSFFIPKDCDVVEPFSTGPLSFILDTAERMYPGITFEHTDPDSAEEMDGVIWRADLPKPALPGTIVIVDESFRV